MSASELGDIAIKVFVADLVKRAFVSSLQDTPKRFHAVDVDILIDILTDTVLD